MKIYIQFKREQVRYPADLKMEKRSFCAIRCGTPEPPSFFDLQTTYKGSIYSDQKQCKLSVKHTIIYNLKLNIFYLQSETINKIKKYSPSTSFFFLSEPMPPKPLQLHPLASMLSLNIKLAGANVFASQTTSIGLSSNTSWEPGTT